MGAVSVRGWALTGDLGERKKGSKVPDWGEERALYQAVTFPCSGPLPSRAPISSPVT